MAKNNQGGGKPQQDKDLSSDASFFWRMVKMLVARAGRAVGDKGFNVKAINVFLTMAEALLGQELTKLGLDALGAAIQNPAAFKKFILGLGWPNEVNQLVDEFIDDVFEGLNGAYATRGKISQADVNQAMTVAGNKIDAKMVQRKYEDLFVLLPAKKQLQLIATIRGLNDADAKRFKALKPKINDYKVLVTIVGMSSVEMFEYLEHIYGEAPKSGDGTSYFDKAAALIKKLTPSPAAHQALRDITASLQQSQRDHQWQEVLEEYPQPRLTRQQLQGGVAWCQQNGEGDKTMLEVYEMLSDGRLSIRSAPRRP